jgi:multiple antibiotic resistance protein
MNHQYFLDSIIVMLVLFNPFLMSIYLMDVLSELNARTFASVLLRAFLISGVVFLLFAWAGDAIFVRVLQVRFAAFLIFGGIVFLVIGLRYLTQGARMVDTLRGSPEHLVGSIAMPFMIGPGTVSASVLAGARLPFGYASLAIVIALAVACALLIIAKFLHDYIKARHATLLERYIEITGRISALVIGTIAIEMILKGIELWLQGAPSG